MVWLWLGMRLAFFDRGNPGHLCPVHFSIGGANLNQVGQNTQLFLELAIISLAPEICVSVLGMCSIVRIIVGVDIYILQYILVHLQKKALQYLGTRLISLSFRTSEGAELSG